MNQIGIDRWITTPFNISLSSPDTICRNNSSLCSNPSVSQENWEKKMKLKESASSEETPKLFHFNNEKQIHSPRVPYAKLVTDIFGMEGSTPEASANKTAPEEPGSYKLTKREKKALEAAPGFKSKHPWFAVPMVKSHKHQLILPFKFVKEHLPKESMNAKIVDSNARAWDIEYKYKKGRSLLYTGWNSFWLCNELKEGDVLAFELIDKKDVKFRVTIRKKTEISIH